MDENLAEEYVTKTEKTVTGYKKFALQAIVATNPIADWADQHLIYEEGTRLQIGVAQKTRIAASPILTSMSLHGCIRITPNFAPLQVHIY